MSRFVEDLEKSPGGQARATLVKPGGRETIQRLESGPGEPEPSSHFTKSLKAFRSLHQVGSSQQRRRGGVVEFGIATVAGGRVIADVFPGGPSGALDLVAALKKRIDRSVEDGLEQSQTGHRVVFIESARREFCVTQQPLQSARGAGEQRTMHSQPEQRGQQPGRDLACRGRRSLLGNRGCRGGEQDQCGQQPADWRATRGERFAGGSARKWPRSPCEGIGAV